jgi:hypothetical protein
MLLSHLILVKNFVHILVCIINRLNSESSQVQTNYLILKVVDEEVGKDEGKRTAQGIVWPDMSVKNIGPKYVGR